MPPPDAASGAPTATLPTAYREETGEAALPTGTRLGRYLIVDRLGEGGMGTVYVAYDTQLARRVAIKVLRPGAGGDEAHARMLREAQTMARLTHPNVLTVYDVGSFGDGVFIAMEYIEGRTLRAWLDEPRGWREVLAVMKAAGRGLEAAHAAGVVHRDFKPDNVFLGVGGRVVVGDFGIARAPEAIPPPSIPEAPSSAPAVSSPPSVPATTTERPRGPAPGAWHTAPLTATDAMIGTIGYMSPERAFEQRDDARSDQFSFCVTLYRALYGAPPFASTSLSAYLEALLVSPRPPPDGSPVPEWVHRTVLRGLAREPADRFASMADLLDALDRDPTRRRRGWLLGAVALVVAGLGVAGWLRHEQALRDDARSGEGLVATTWGPAAHAAVSAGIVATKVELASDNASRAEAALDAYAAEWARVHREASEATLLRGQATRETLRARLRCLEAQREDLRALVDDLSRADEVVARHAIGAAYGLPIPRMCLEPSVVDGAPDSPERAARVAALRRTVAEASAHRMTGKYDDALAAAMRGLGEARAIPHRQSEAELLFLVAACKRELEDDAVARVTLEEAFAASEAAGNDSLAAIAAATISLELSDTLADVHEAERWLGIAKAIRERAGPDDRADAEVLEAELALVSAEGHADKTVLLRDRLVTLLERIYGSAHPRIAVAIANQAGDVAAVGQPDLAVTLYRRAIAMQEHLFGPDAPTLSIYYNNLGSTLTEATRYAEAKVALDHALALVAPLGADNAHNVLPLVSLAQLDAHTGDFDAALAAAERGIAIADASGQSEARFLPALLVQQGGALLAKGDAAGAQRACARALRLQDEQEIFGPDRIVPDANDSLTCVGEAETALGRLSDALEHLERSVSLTKRQTPTDLSLARFALARALTAAKRDPRRARDLADTARRELRAAPGMDRQAGEVEAWIATVGAR
jgi:tetratricopeptide (TPR) repeat protein/predicted Ser/Thr protein kinase